MNALVRTSVYQIKQWMKVRSLILETQWRKRNMALVNKNLFVQRLSGFLVNTSKMLHAIPRHCYIRLIIRLLDCVDSWHPRHTGPQVATSAWVNCLLQQADNLGASFLQKVVCFKVDRMSAFSQFGAARYSADLWRWKPAGLQGHPTAAHPPFQTECQSSEVNMLNWKAEEGCLIMRGTD